MQERAKDFKNGKSYDEISSILAQSISQNIQAGGRPKWKPRKFVYSHPILDKSGTMRDAAESSAMQWLHRPTEHINQIKSTDYGEVHQYRGVRTKKGENIQKIIRKFVVIQQQEQTAMITAFRKAFLRE